MAGGGTTLTCALRRDAVATSRRRVDLRRQRRKRRVPDNVAHTLQSPLLADIDSILLHAAFHLRGMDMVTGSCVPVLTAASSYHLPPE